MFYHSLKLNRGKNNNNKKPFHLSKFCVLSMAFFAITSSILFLHKTKIGGKALIENYYILKSIFY